MLDEIRAGKGSIGALMVDEAVYDDLQELLRDSKLNPWKIFLARVTLGPVSHLRASGVSGCVEPGRFDSFQLVDIPLSLRRPTGRSAAPKAGFGAWGAHEFPDSFGKRCRGTAIRLTKESADC